MPKKASSSVKHKPHKPPRKSALHDSELVPITDPAVQAALEHVCRNTKPAVPAILREYAKTQSRKKQRRSNANGNA